MCREKKCSDAFTVTACVRDLKASVVPVSPAGLLMKLQEVLLPCGLPDNLFFFLSDVQLKTHCCCKKKSTSEKPETIKFGSYDSKLILTINLLR